MLGYSIPTPIVDAKGHIVAVVVPAPTDAVGWRKGIIAASAVFDSAASYADYSRLAEPILKTGVEYGCVRGVVSSSLPLLSQVKSCLTSIHQRPQNVKHDLANCVEVALLMQSDHVREIAAFQNGEFVSKRS